MSEVWRLLDTGALPAAHNMALDNVILTARSRELIPNTVRFLQFSPHCALVGYHQEVGLEVEEEYCRQHGIEINRRITGGGNLYWDEGQLGWEVYARKDTPGIPKRLEEIYRLMCECAVKGLSRLGVNAAFRPQNDIEVGGRKICGSGGTGIGDAFMYQGSMLTDFDVDTMIRCLKLPLKKLEDKQVQSFKERVTCLKEVLGRLPSISVIKQALVEGFAEGLNIKLETGGLTDQERQLMGEQLPRFQSEEWIYGGRPKIQDSSLSVVDYKTSGGLIRVSIMLDRSRRRIKSAFITGDFFAYPERSILDLEAVLKNSSSYPQDVLYTVRQFFTEHEVRIPGIEADDFYYVLNLAIAKAGEDNN